MVLSGFGEGVDSYVMMNEDSLMYFRKMLPSLRVKLIPFIQHLDNGSSSKIEPIGDPRYRFPEDVLPPRLPLRFYQVEKEQSRPKLIRDRVELERTA